MADGDFGDAVDFEEPRQVVEVEVVASVDADAGVVGLGRGAAIALPADVGFGVSQTTLRNDIRIGAGVELHPVRANALRRRKLLWPRIDEQTDARAQRLVPGYRLGNALPIRAVGQIPAVIGRQLPVRVRHQRALVRSDGVDQGVEARIAAAGQRVRIAFDVELRARMPRHHVAQGMDVGSADMPFVRARMHGDAVGAGFEGNAGACRNVRARTAAGVAQPRHLVDVDGERGHADSPALALSPASSFDAVPSLSSFSASPAGSCPLAAR